MQKQDFQSWYVGLVKPSWTPDPSTIGLIWSLLYPIIIAVNIAVIYKLKQGEIGLAVALPFWLNVGFNLAFTPVQFGLRNLALACVVILLVWGTIIWSMVAIWPHSKWLAIAFVPYFIWVTIASLLQINITLANR